MKYAAILFDLDGTLVDTIALYERACLQAYGEHGLRMSPEKFRELYVQGVSLHNIGKEYGISEDAFPAIRTRRDALYHDLLGTHTSWLPGAETLLTHVKTKRPLGVLTGSWKTYVDAMRPRTDIFRYTDAVVTADHTLERSKPHPHGLFLVADLLNVKPEDCLYIGDQTFDMEAANAAGMTSCLIRGTYTPNDAHEEADLVAETLAHVFSFL